MNSTIANTSAVFLMSPTRNNGLNWFAAQEVEWGNFHYISISYVLPVICVLAFVENLAILVVLSRLKAGIGHSARIYYSLLAAFNFINVATLHLINSWSTMGLQYATQNSFFFSAVNYIPWVCKIIRSQASGFSVLVSWTYVLLNVERVFAIAFPLRAKSTFSVRQNMMYVGVVSVFGVLVWAYYLYIMQTGPTAILMGPVICLADSSSLAKAIIYQLINSGAIYVLPPALNLFLGLLLLAIIQHQQKRRAHLMSGTSGKSADTPSSAAIAGGIVVVTIALVHAIIDLPAGCFGTFYWLYVNAIFLFVVFLINKFF